MYVFWNMVAIYIKLMHLVLYEVKQKLQYCPFKV